MLLSYLGERYNVRPFTGSQIHQNLDQEAQEQSQVRRLNIRKLYTGMVGIWATSIHVTGNRGNGIVCQSNGGPKRTGVELPRLA